MATFLNALIGAVVAVVLSFVPFSPTLGGAVAGFLEGTDGKNGAIAGAVSGLFTLLPLAIGGFLLLAFLGFVSVGAAEVFLVGGAFVLLFLVATTLYTVGLAALGGYLGAHLAREYPDARADARDTLGMAPDSARSSEAFSRHDSRAADALETEPRDGWDGDREDAGWDGDRDDDTWGGDRDVAGWGEAEADTYERERRE